MSSLMHRFDVMREHARSGVGADFVSGLVWVYGRDEIEGRRIQLFGGSGFAASIARYLNEMAEARAHGFDDRAIWAKRVQDGGDGYFSLRSAPRIRIAASSAAAAADELAEIAAEDTQGAAEL